MTVLYRKYRPQKFSEVVGQVHVVKTLTNAVRDNAAAHAYLFAGPRGTGKTTIARLLAKAVNCYNRKDGEGEPCLKCDSCVEIAKGSSMDLVEIDAASNRGIDEMRQLKEGVRFVPNKSKFKVFIIDECHGLTREAASAFLKVLEEPPEHAIFILATTDPQKMIPTIASRCQRFDFRRFSISEIVRRMEHILPFEKREAGREALELIASNAAGSIRDAESMLGQMLNFCEGNVSYEKVREVLGVPDVGEASHFADLLVEGKGGEALAKIQEILDGGADPYQFMNILTSYVRQMLLAKVDKSLISPEVVVLGEEQKAKLISQIESVSLPNLKKMTDILLEAERRMKYSPIIQLPLETAAIEIIETLNPKP